MTKHPDETMPALKPTDTQRFHSPLESMDDPNKTHPNIVVGTFPKGSAKAPERPPTLNVDAMPQIGETRLYEGSLKLIVTKVEPGKGFVGIDGNGIEFFVPESDVKKFILVEGDVSANTTT